MLRLHPLAVVLAEVGRVGSYPECGQHDEARVCMFTRHSPAPQPAWVLSYLECPVWDVHCGLDL